MSRSFSYGPLTFTVERDGQPVSNDAFFDGFPSWARETGTVEKLVARFSIAVDGDVIVGNSPFFYGSTDRPDEQPDARSIADSVLSDLRSIGADMVGVDVDADDLDRWAAWADDFGAFAGGWSAEQVRESIGSFRSIAAWESLILERVGAAAYLRMLEDWEGE